MTWIALAVFAAVAQNIRFILQKHLAGSGLSVAGATFSRYVWSAPALVIIIPVLFWIQQEPLPEVSLRFLIFICLGGSFQILATFCVVALFKQRNFTVGITFKKTEVLQAAVFGILILGDSISPAGWLVILLGVVGVILLSDPPRDGVKSFSFARMFNRATALGIGSGIFFGICGVCYRGAALSTGVDNMVLTGLFSLACAVFFQAGILAAYMRTFEQGEISRVMGTWRITSLVGLTSMIGSGCLFMAFSVQNTAYVNAIGQIEVVFAAFASYFVFNERTKPREICGIALVVISIILLILIV